jgi:hypothetical protein
VKLNKEQSFQNGNRISNVKCERIMTVILEKKRTTNPFENHDGLQIESSIN